MATEAAGMAGTDYQLRDNEFAQFQGLLYRLVGISLSPAKKALVSGRLVKRIRHHRLNNFGDYFRLLTSGSEPQELQIAIDLLTTNETYFFREPKHFEFLRSHILPSRQPGSPFRVWSAACSSGEEPYSIAMLLADCLQEAPWEIVASDISTRVLERARNSLYAMERAKHIPQDYLRAYCLKGIGRQEGTFMIDKRLRSRIKFMQVNLNDQLPRLGEFNVIFLRNVMIYFDVETKRKVVQRLLAMLKPGGYLLVGHSESLNGVFDGMDVMAPSIYRKK